MPTVRRERSHELDREFGFIEARLREWAAHSGCAGQHHEPLRPLRPSDDDAWDRYVEAEVERRQRRRSQLLRSRSRRGIVFDGLG